MKKQVINENLSYVTDKNFTIQIDGDEEQFGIAFETINMLDATGEPEFKKYPFLVSAYIVADKCHKSFYEGEGKADKLGCLSDALSYMGGVPVDHILTHSIRSGAEASNSLDESNFELLAKQFNSLEAKIVSSKQDYGTIAAQNGKNHEHQWLQFRTEEAAEKFIDLIIKNRLSAISMLVGFVLDKPLNMAGDDGWSHMEKMIKGCK